MPTYIPDSKFDTVGQGYDESNYDIGLLTDAISLNIVDIKTISGIKTKDETLSIIDTKATSGNLSKAETLSIIDTWVIFINFSETLNIIDSKVTSTTQAKAETLGIIDSKATSGPLTFNELLQLIDNYRTNMFWIRTSKGTGEWTEKNKGTGEWTEKTKGTSLLTETEIEKI